MIDLSAYSTTTRVLALAHFCGVTPRLFEALLRRFRTLDAVFSADLGQLLEIEGLGRRQAEQLEHASEQLSHAEAMVRSLRDRDIRLVTRFDEAYGRLLFELHDPPSLLYLRGHSIDPDKRTIAVAGTRQASSEGLELTSRLVKELVRYEIQIVSSLLGGVDTAVHLAARSAGGRSFAVIDCGLDQIGQGEGIPVAIDILQTGGVISEYAPNVTAGTKTMTESNRLIVGLVQAVVVTEFYGDSTRTLDLLRACRDIGKLVFLLIDPRYGALSDAPGLRQAHEFGVIPITGFDKIDDVVKSLV
ncbi:MAG: DNA-processing protein DprA [Candidatus Zixiibacteriota bacterium]